jgi:SAM-dependent methyltransferase
MADIKTLVNKLLDTPPRRVVRALSERFGRKSAPTPESILVRGFDLQAASKPFAMRFETSFRRDDGSTIPVFGEYRYAIKPAWRNIPLLHGLAELASVGALSPAERDFLAHARGHRTLTRSLGEIDSVVQPVIRANRDLFLPETIRPGAYPTLKTRVRSSRGAVETHMRFYSSILDTLAVAGVYAPRPQPRAIEIGMGQGTASVALAHLGFQTIGIDNNYGGAMDADTALAAAIAAAEKVELRFEQADITARTPFHDGAFDLVISNSVLEHINDLGAALREIARLVAPGGVIVQRYHPYFGPSGGHAFGTLDAPWAHVRLSEAETHRYLDELRPHESPLAKRWVDQALTRAWPIARVQKTLIDSGFEIVGWSETPASENLLRGLDGGVISDALRRNANIALADLVTDTVTFVCRRIQ